MIGASFMEVNPKTKVPQFSVLVTGGVMMLIVLFFDITFLAQFISMSTLVGYCLIMSIVVFKKMARKTFSAVLQSILFLISMTLGFIHSMQVFDDYFMITMISLIAVNMLIIMVEHKRHPDLEAIEEDLRENKTFKDTPYTCMLSPFLPSIGISVSGIVLGYMDIVVWATFFIVVFLTILSYFLYVVPKKHREKLKKQSETQFT